MKKLKSFEDYLLESFNNKIFEKKINPPTAGFTKLDIENILRKDRDMEIFVEDGDKGTRYYITPYMHINGKMHKATDTIFYAVDNKGREAEIEYSNVTYIQT